MSHLFRFFYASLFCLVLTSGAFAEEATSWSYQGDDGPENWASLGVNYNTCGGGQQSPVGLQSSTAISADVPSVYLDLEQFKPTVINDGHMIKVTSEDAGGLITYQGKNYRLAEIHFHHQSEHVIDGRNYELEAQFFMRSKEGGLFVFGVLFLVGPANATLQTIIENVPMAVGKKSLDGYIDPATLLPVDTRFFHYMGSLTTPPCSENVTWHVFKEALTASKAQINAFSHLYPDNHRPLQQLNRRYVLEGK